MKRRYRRYMDCARKDRNNSKCLYRKLVSLLSEYDHGSALNQHAQEIVHAIYKRFVDKELKQERKAASQMMEYTDSDSEDDESDDDEVDEERRRRLQSLMLSILPNTSRRLNQKAQMQIICLYEEFAQDERPKSPKELKKERKKHSEGLNKQMAALDIEVGA